MKHKLLIKTHNKTGLNYLCYTRKEDYKAYNGSGKLWIKHIKKYGSDISTKLIFETNNKKQFVKVAKKKSLELNVIKSKKWANLKIEEGDGGNTVSQKRWITDGKTDIYINKNQKLPNGWKPGRSNCIFNDSNKQREFGKRVDIKKRANSIKLAWNNKNNNKFGTRKNRDISGVNNPLSNSENKLKHLLSNRTPEIRKFRSELMKKNKPWLKRSISLLKK